MQINNLVLICFKSIILIILIFCLIFIIKYTIYNPKDKLLYAKYLNIKIQYEFRFLIMLLALLFALNKIFVCNDLIIGIYASAIVWGFVEIIGTFLKDCATYETEKEMFYSDIHEKLGDAKAVIKNGFDNINYKELRNKILNIYNIIVDSQQKYSIFSLSDEFLAIHNYIAIMLENFDAYYDNDPSKLYELIIIDSERKIDNTTLNKELKIDKLNSIIQPNFDTDKIYKFRGIKSGNEGDILNQISLEMPQSVKRLCTFKPISEIDKYINLNNNLSHKQVLKILFCLNWFK